VQPRLSGVAAARERFGDAGLYTVAALFGLTVGGAALLFFFWP
jgi:hypothetical protein